ncbi:hypothetical protein C7C46_04845 [Streptomyces tateyamensis]|uniref:Uncharacterized protein n=1 Tax=Streptomyces tateyamensis TaxID=565073 RepID=A0A2V4NPC6_9ACTN|nr:hypothetical protein [Streptomyces tateyamensis]PYC87410.1 hypothetical protein C7C46_04845 [Streptomyces tateyamensis]
MSAGRGSVATDGTVGTLDLRLAAGTLRCFATGEAQPRLQVRTGCVPGEDVSLRLVHDALVLPRLRDCFTRLAPTRPVTDHERLVGVELTVPQLDAGQLLDQAAEALASGRQAVSAARADDLDLDRVIAVLAAVRTRGSHDLATLATLGSAPGGPVHQVAGARLTARQVTERLIDGGRAVIADAPAQADRVAGAAVLTATHGPAPAPAAVESEAVGGPEQDLPIRLPRPAAPPRWLEVESPRAELAYLQLRRAIPQVATVRALAAALVANQARFGAYSSVVDDAIRSELAASYLWDCVVDLTRGEFLMLAAPAVEDADRVARLVLAEHAGGAALSRRAVATARRIVRSALLRRIGPAQLVLTTQSEVQRAGLPIEFTASLLAAVQDVGHEEVAAARDADDSPTPAVTLVLPAARPR